MTDESYFHAHASPEHLAVREMLSGVTFQEWVLLEECLIDFYFPESQQAICLLDEEHDHTDAYLREKVVQDRLEKAGYEVRFLRTYELREKTAGSVADKLKAWIRT